MQYEDIPPFSEKVKFDLESTNPNKVLMALLSVVMNSDDYNFSIETIQRFLKHENEYVRGAAIECISHAARLWRKLPHRFIDAVHHAIHDPSDWVKGKADFAMDDLTIFIEGYKRPST
jgi:hypothetical protein